MLLIFEAVYKVDFLDCDGGVGFGEGSSFGKSGRVREWRRRPDMKGQENAEGKSRWRGGLRVEHRFRNWGLRPCGGELTTNNNAITSCEESSTSPESFKKCSLKGDGPIPTTFLDEERGRLLEAFVVRQSDDDAGRVTVIDEKVDGKGPSKYCKSVLI
jgi:hypothetical protein